MTVPPLVQGILDVRFDATCRPWGRLHEAGKGYHRKVRYSIRQAKDMAADGLSAVAKSRRRSFDVILMDIVMPGMDGVEAFRKIRQINPGARVILMSAYYEDEVMEEVLSEGVHSALCKPIDIAWVIEMIKGIVLSPSILIVDDDPDFCQTMATMFELEGYRVYAANSGEEAVEIAKERECQVAFVDFKLPLMDGLETYLKLKEINPGLVTIMVTAYRDEVKSKMAKALAASAATCLYKPFNPSEAIGLVSAIGAKLPYRRCRNSS